MSENYDIEFVKWLLSLPHTSEGRSTVAHLRRLSVDDEYIVPELMPWIANLDDPRPAQIVAGMFGLYAAGLDLVVPDRDQLHNFGWSAKRLKHELSPGGDPHGVEKHFRVTLEKGLEHKLPNFKWFFQMFRLHKINVNWLLFMNAMMQWTGDEEQPFTKQVRLEWGKAFWG